jgi:tetratricopeptide (TPR) repeat protein
MTDITSLPRSLCYICIVLLVALLVEQDAAAQSACGQLGVKCSNTIGRGGHGSSRSGNSGSTSASRSPQPSYDYTSLASEYNVKANAAFDNDDYPRAIQLYRLALHLNPQSSTIHSNLLIAEALMEFDAGVYHTAIQHMRSAINEYDRREPWILNRYSKFLNQDDCERRMDCKPKRGGDWDCPRARSSDVCPSVEILTTLTKCVGRPVSNDGLCD